MEGDLVGSKLTGVKHLVECHCILPQYRNYRNPVYHKFVVFSVVNDDDHVRTKHVKCNNCGVIHKVHEIHKSEIMVGKEQLSSVATIDDIKLSLPERLSDILESYDVLLATWEECQFVLDERKWGSQIMLNREAIEGETHGKMLVIKGKNQFRIEGFQATSEVSL